MVCMKVETEKEEGKLPQAIVYGSGDLAFALARTLKKQELRVAIFEPEVQALPVLEKPQYLFSFINSLTPLANSRVILDESRFLARKNGAKLILVLENVSKEVEEKLLQDKKDAGWPATVVEVHGKMDGPAGKLSEEAASKLARAAFGTAKNEKLVIIGKDEKDKGDKKDTKIGPPLGRKSVQDVFDQLKKHRKRSAWHFTKILGKLIFLLGILIIFLPFLVQLLVFGRAGFSLWQATRSLRTGNFVRAQTQSLQAKEDLGFLKSLMADLGSWLGPLGIITQTPHDLFAIGETGADTVYRLGKISQPVEALTQGLLSGKRPPVGTVEQISTNLGQINTNLGLLEASLPQIISGQAAGILEFLGAPVKKISGYTQKLAIFRQGVTQAESFLKVWEEIIPPAETKTYLLVFQNSTELRPTGGFIGSYGLVKFSSGKLLDYKIYDIYTADNQLRGQINPPDEILHFLGQPNWYMRDSNWAADFPLTAKRLIWFLEKETGQKVDGVVGINLGAVQKILQATGPLELTDLSQTVSAHDFFEKAEYNAEINFFAGSTGKKDFLGATANAILENLTSNSAKNLPMVSNAFLNSLNEKEILFFFSDPSVQKAAVGAGWAGTIELPVCQENQKNCLMLVEANLGANKANYFLKRSLRVDAVVGKGGEIENTVTVLYQNDSPSDTWPGGVYKNYFRFLIPYGSTVSGFDLGNGKKPVTSSLLTAAELEKVRSDEFFVFQSMESGFSSFGSLVEVPVGETRTIVFKYRLPTKLNFSDPVNNLTFCFLKQPGTNPDYLDYTVEYPSFLEPQVDLSLDNKPLVFAQKLVYNSDNQIDRRFLVKFKNKIL